MTDRCDQAQEIMTRFAGKETSWDENQEIYNRYLVHARTCAQCTQARIDTLNATNKSELADIGKPYQVNDPKVIKAGVAAREKQIAKLNARLRVLESEVQV